jgi:hypothetical protein
VSKNAAELADESDAEALQDVWPEAYPYAYLVTAPQLLGYHFNPVSFWYLFDRDKVLRAMIVEVNNTFDERRIYFLKDVTEEPFPELPAVYQTQGSLPGARAPSIPEVSNRFKGTWPKDFHVSPFNSRDGYYYLTAGDPIGPIPRGKGPIVNSITLRSAEGLVTLVACVYSTGEAIDPAHITFWGACRFLLSWSWVGLLTFPRIVREAGKLFLKRHLGINLYFRPEVKRSSIAREESPAET